MTRDESWFFYSYSLEAMWRFEKDEGEDRKDHTIDSQKGMVIISLGIEERPGSEYLTRLPFHDLLEDFRW
jgi:hypothetical protein